MALGSRTRVDVQHILLTAVGSGALGVDALIADTLQTLAVLKKNDRRYRSSYYVQNAIGKLEKHGLFCFGKEGGRGDAGATDRRRKPGACTIRGGVRNAATTKMGREMASGHLRYSRNQEGAARQDQAQSRPLRLRETAEQHLGISVRMRGSDHVSESRLQDRQGSPLYRIGENTE